MTTTIADLKRRRNYIIAKITRIAGEEQVKDYMKLMLFIVECGYEKTIYDLIMEVHEHLRVKSRKTNKVAEAFAATAEKNGTAKYGWDGKDYGRAKWGEQSNLD